VEIQDYLLAIRRRLWLVIALPLVAALVTAGFIYIQPEKYQATATVIVPALSAKGYSTSASVQYFSSFKDVLISAPVVSQIAAETGESKSNVAAGLSATTTTASSNIILVTYVGPNKTNVQAVARIASVDTLDALMGPQVAATQMQIVNSEKALRDANQALATFATTAGPNNVPPAPGLLPEDTYRSQVGELSLLELNLELAKIEGNKNRIASLSGAIAGRTAILTSLETQVAAWKILQQDQLAAQAENDKAHSDFNAASSEYAADSDPRSVTAQFSGHVSRVPEIARAAGEAGGVALLLALAYIVFMEFLQPARRSAAGSGRPLAFAQGRLAPQPAAKVAAGAGAGGAGVSSPTAPPAQTAPEPPLTGAAGRSNGEL
jgi:capsular polysaccharide biosynthesis protein